MPFAIQEEVDRHAVLVTTDYIGENLNNNIIKIIMTLKLNSITFLKFVTCKCAFTSIKIKHSAKHIAFFF